MALGGRSHCTTVMCQLIPPNLPFPSFRSSTFASASMHGADASSVVQHGMPDLHSNCALTRDRIILNHFAFRCWVLGEEDRPAELLVSRVELR